MTLKQWLLHLRQWWFSVLQFPNPWNGDVHMWVGAVGKREQRCMICGMEGIDRELSDEELARDVELGKAYDKVNEEFFGKESDV
jgi:hypothetical protein